MHLVWTGMNYRSGWQILTVSQVRTFLPGIRILGCPPDLCLHRGLQPTQPEPLREVGHAPGRHVHGICVFRQWCRRQSYLWKYDAVCDLEIRMGGKTTLFSKGLIIRNQFRTRKICGIHFVLRWQLLYCRKSSSPLMRHQFWYPFTGENAINWLRTVIVRKDKKYVITQETLNSTLSEDGKWMFQEYQDLREQMAYISEEDMFVSSMITISAFWKYPFCEKKTRYCS